MDFRLLIDLEAIEVLDSLPIKLRKRCWFSSTRFVPSRAAIRITMSRMLWGGVSRFAFFRVEPSIIGSISLTGM